MRSRVGFNGRHNRSNARHREIVDLSIDERLAERLTIEIPLTYVIALSNGQLQGRTMTINLSGTGVQFPIPWMVPKSIPCHLTLALPTRTEPLMLTGLVVWCRPGSNRNREAFEVGISLEDPSSGSEEAFAQYCHFVATQLLQRYLPCTQPRH